ncbi:hypothetical protein AMTR_s00050p00117590 [Amborella trichopoda]|uniref:Uncharacterized protein n=1 Tax=Amborella trichopoda TaxID=13333 RepID=W1PY66_AMBTC|nr:hypothetical protein AMTR_s00050p00117590 [Amborella trichopoda]
MRDVHSWRGQAHGGWWDITKSHNSQGMCMQGARVSKSCRWWPEGDRRWGQALVVAWAHVRVTRTKMGLIGGGLENTHVCGSWRRARGKCTCWRDATGTTGDGWVPGSGLSSVKFDTSRGGEEGSKRQNVRFRAQARA